MAFDNASLRATHSLLPLNVSSAHQISNRTSAIISRLNPGEQSSDDQKTVIVMLTAKAKAAGKLISIVEIAKRELTSAGIRCYQYTALGSELVEIERHSKSTKKGAAGEGESDDAFETMGGLQESATKKRSMPVLTIYLSRASVKELKVAFGYANSHVFAVLYHYKRSLFCTQ